MGQASALTSTSFFPILGSLNCPAKTRMQEIILHLLPKFPVYESHGAPFKHATHGIFSSICTHCRLVIKNIFYPSAPGLYTTSVREGEPSHTRDSNLLSIGRSTLCQTQQAFTLQGSEKDYLPSRSTALVAIVLHVSVTAQHI